MLKFTHKRKYPVLASNHSLISIDPLLALISLFSLRKLLNMYLGNISDSLSFENASYQTPHIDKKKKHLT